LGVSQPHYEKTCARAIFNSHAIRKLELTLGETQKNTGDLATISKIQKIRSYSNPGTNGGANLQSSKEIGNLEENGGCTKRKGWAKIIKEIKLGPLSRGRGPEINAEGRQFE